MFWKETLNTQIYLQKRVLLKFESVSKVTEVLGQ